MHFSPTKILLLCFIPCSFAIAQGERPDHERQRRAATDEYVRGHFDKSEALYLDALRQAEAKNDHYAAAVSLLGLGNIYQNQGHYSDAQAAYLKSLSVVRRVPDADFTTAAVLHNLADSHTAVGQYREALIALNQSSRMAQKVESQSHELNGLISNSYGAVYFYQGKYRKAESHFRKAIENYSRGRSAFAADIAQSENNLAEVYRSRRKFRNAEESFKKSIVLAEQQLGPSHPDLAVTLENLGSLYVELKRYSEAEVQYLRSLAILEEDKSLKLRQIHALHLLSGLYIRQGENVQAEVVLARAAEIIGPHPMRSAEIPHVLETYSRLLKSVGKLQQAQAEHSRALRASASNAFIVHMEDLTARTKR